MKLVKNTLSLFLILISFTALANDKTGNCVSEENSDRVTIQCMDGTVSVTTYSKFVVCYKTSNGTMACQEKDL